MFYMLMFIFDNEFDSNGLTMGFNFFLFILQPMGMVTRKDLAKFRVGSKRGLVKIEQLKIEDK